MVCRLHGGFIRDKINFQYVWINTGKSKSITNIGYRNLSVSFKLFIGHNEATDDERMRFHSENLWLK